MKELKANIISGGTLKIDAEKLVLNGKVAQEEQPITIDANKVTISGVVKY